MHTFCTSVAHAYLNAIVLHFNQASHTLLHIGFIKLVWVRFLPIYDHVFISWTNLDLIKFVFVSCGFAIGSLLCVCSFADVSPFLSWKRTSEWCSIIPYFKTDSSFNPWLKQREIQDSPRFSDIFQHFWKSSYCGGMDCEIWYPRNDFYSQDFWRKRLSWFIRELQGSNWWTSQGVLLQHQIYQSWTKVWGPRKGIHHYSKLHCRCPSDYSTSKGRPHSIWR